MILVSLYPFCTPLSQLNFTIQVIVAENKDGKPPVVGAFIVPNEPIGYDKKLTDYQVSSC